MIPKLIQLCDSHPLFVLPPGTHRATLEEIEVNFAITPYRQRLFRGFCSGCESLLAAGCGAIYLDGSFTTSKIHPGDFDACWDPAGVDLTKIDATLLDFSNRRAAQKQKYGGEFFISSANALPGLPYLDFFQQDRETGYKKGILLLDFENSTI